MDELLIVLTVLVGMAIADIVIIGIYIRNVMHLNERLTPFIHE